MSSGLTSFFFSSRRRHTRLQGDWSSDVCSSDLPAENASFHGRWVLMRYVKARLRSVEQALEQPLVFVPRGLRQVKDALRSEEHTSELQSPCNIVCRLLLEKKKQQLLSRFVSLLDYRRA